MEFKTTSQVVGGFYTTPAEVRGLDSISGDTSTFPAADVVDAITLAMQKIEDKNGDIINIASGKGTKIIELAEMMISISGKKSIY